MRPGLPRFSRSSASVYYTERKPKNKKRGRPGNEARSPVLFEVAFQGTASLTNVHIPLGMMHRILVIQLPDSAMRGWGL